MTPFAPPTEPMPDSYITEVSQVLARFTIPGNPRPKERPRHGHGFTFTPKGTVIAEESVLAAFNATYPDWAPIDIAVKLELRANFYRDSRIRVDTDNLAKLVQDALNKHAFVDDVQVFDLIGRKWFTSKGRGRTEVVITRIDGDRVEVAL